MDCDKAIHQVYAYLDGELTVWKRLAITRHLDECPPCPGLLLRDRAAAGDRVEVPEEVPEGSGAGSPRRSGSKPSGLSARPTADAVCGVLPMARPSAREASRKSEEEYVRPTAIMSLIAGIRDRRSRHRRSRCSCISDRNRRQLRGTSGSRRCSRSVFARDDAEPRRRLLGEGRTARDEGPPAQ